MCLSFNLTSVRRTVGVAVIKLFYLRAISVYSGHLVIPAGFTPKEEPQMFSGWRWVIQRVGIYVMKVTEIRNIYTDVGYRSRTWLLAHSNYTWMQLIELESSSAELPYFGNYLTTIYQKSVLYVRENNVYKKLGFVVPCIFNHSNKTPN
jgi:hypothetical protein